MRHSNERDDCQLPFLSECRITGVSLVVCIPSLGIHRTDLLGRNDLLNADQLQNLCVDSCYTSLTSARQVIQTACTQSTDVIVYEDIAYPGQ